MWRLADWPFRSEKYENIIIGCVISTVYEKLQRYMRKDIWSCCDLIWHSIYVLLHTKISDISCPCSVLGHQCTSCNSNAMLQNLKDYVISNNTRPMGGLLTQFLVSCSSYYYLTKPSNTKSMIAKAHLTHTPLPPMEKALQVLATQVGEGGIHTQPQ